MARKSITFLMLLLFIFGCATPTTAQQPIPVRPTTQGPIPVISRAQVLTILQKKVEHAEQEVLVMLQQIYMENDPKLGGKADKNRNSQLVHQIRLSVAKLFKLRMQLQTAQLDDAEEKLKTSRQRLVRRQSLAKQIVDRRVNELINNDETKWNEQPLDAQKLASPKPKPDPKPTGLSELVARDEIESLANACDFYKFQVGAFPAKLLDFSQLPNGLTQAQWGGPYQLITPISNDPWNRPYKYTPNDEANVVLIQSAGPDGQFGSEDDVSNAQAIVARSKGRRGSSVAVQRVYKPSAKSKIEDKKQMLSKLTKDLSRSETALEYGRGACLQHVWLLENTGKITSGSLQVASNSKQIGRANENLKELELERDQLIIIRNYGPNHRETKLINLRIKKLKAEIDRLIKQEAKISGILPEQIIQSYIVGIKQQISDLRLALDSDLAINHENYEKAVKSELADGRTNRLVDELDNSDAAQLAAQTFLDLYFSGDIEKATELTNNPRPIKTLREFVEPGTSAAPKVIGFSGGSFEANVSTDGVVQLKKALPKTGHTQATLGLRMQKNDSNGWRVLEVFLGGLKTGDREAPLPSTPDQSEYQQLLGNWEVVSIEGKGG